MADAWAASTTKPNTWALSTWGDAAPLGGMADAWAAGSWKAGSWAPKTWGDAAAPSGDVTSPICAIIAPADLEFVDGTVLIQFNASDNVGVVSVAAIIDGVEQALDIAAPFTFSWDTTLVADGGHTISGIARDLAGNTGIAPVIVVIVENVIPLGTVDNLGWLVARYGRGFRGRRGR